MHCKKIDLHSHILPDIDDGPKTINESIQIVRSAAEQGVTNMIATPHYIPGENQPDSDTIFEKVYLLQKELDQRGILCKIHPGMELFLTSELINHLDQDLVIPLGGTGKYVLVEFPNNQSISKAGDLLYEVNLRGYIPIIAHPERITKLQGNPRLINELFEFNVLLQVNASSIIGTSGKQTRKVVLDLVKQGYVSFVASDAHSIDRRPVNLTQAYETLNGMLKSEKMNDLFYANALTLLSGEEVKIESGGTREKGQGLLSGLKSLFG